MKSLTGVSVMVPFRIPRQTVRFLGTVRFASRSCHNEKEQSRKDDLESWCYMVLDVRLIFDLSVSDL